MFDITSSCWCVSYFEASFIFSRLLTFSWLEKKNDHTRWTRTQRQPDTREMDEQTTKPLGCVLKSMHAHPSCWRRKRFSSYSPNLWFHPRQSKESRHDINGETIVQVEQNPSMPPVRAICSCYQKVKKILAPPPSPPYAKSSSLDKITLALFWCRCKYNPISARAVCSVWRSEIKRCGLWLPPLLLTDLYLSWRPRTGYPIASVSRTSRKPINIHARGLSSWDRLLGV